MKSVKLKLKRDAVQGIVACIKELLKYEYFDDIDKLVLAVLADLAVKLEKKLVENKKEYGFKLSAPYALALRILHNEFMEAAPGAYIHNVLLQISNTVHQQYQ